MSKFVRETAKVRRTSIDDLAAVSDELTDERLLLVGGMGPHSIGLKGTYAGGGFEGLATYTVRF